MDKRLEQLRENVVRVLLVVAAIGVILLIFEGTTRLRVYAYSTFKDLEMTDWYYEDIKEVADRDIIKGYPDGTFKPDGTVTYAEYITMVVKSYLESDPGNSDEEHWALNYYNKGIEKGLFTPFDVAKYQLDQEIPREIMAVVMSNSLGEEELEDYSIIKSIIHDLGNVINKENEYHIIQSYGYGILTGYPDGSFKPERTLTRGESATVIRRYIEPFKRIKPDITKIKEELEKEKKAENYWMNDPEYEELVAWVEEETPHRYKNDGWMTGNEGETRIASYSPEFRLKNGRFIVIRQGNGNYKEESIKGIENYPKIHEHVYKTFKILKDLAEKHNLYLGMSYNDVTDGIEIYLKTSYINYNSTMFMLRFSNSPSDETVINGQMMDVEVLPYIEFMQGTYSAGELGSIERSIEMKRIGHEDYPKMIKDIFKMLYGEAAGNNIADYAMEKYQNSYDYEERHIVDLPYDKQNIDGYNISYDNDFDGQDRFNIDRP